MRRRMLPRPAIPPAWLDQLRRDAKQMIWDLLDVELPIVAAVKLRYTKQAVNQALKQALLTSFDPSTALEIVTFQSDDHREALAALREKRAPHFRGR